MLVPFPSRAWLKSGTNRDAACCTHCVFSMSQSGRHPGTGMPASIRSLHLSPTSSPNGQRFFLLSVQFFICSRVHHNKIQKQEAEATINITFYRLFLIHFKVTYKNKSFLFLAQSSKGCYRDKTEPSLVTEEGRQMSRFVLLLLHFFNSSHSSQTLYFIFPVLLMTQMCWKETKKKWETEKWACDTVMFQPCPTLCHLTTANVFV